MNITVVGMGVWSSLKRQIPAPLRNCIPVGQIGPQESAFEMPDPGSLGELKLRMLMSSGLVTWERQ